MSSFEFLLSAAASRQLLDLPADKQWRAFSAIELLAEHPFTTGLPQWVGSDGRTNYLRIVHEWVLTFSVDHADRKVRVLEISSL